MDDELNLQSESEKTTRSTIPNKEENEKASKMAKSMLDYYLSLGEEDDDNGENE